MKFGYCTGSGNADLLKEAGFNYIEPAVNEVIPGSSEEEFSEKRENLKNLSLPCMAFNCFIPGNFSIIESYLGKNFDVLDYAKTAIRRVAEAGGKIIVLGSGGARKCPDGVDKKTAVEMLAKFARDCGEYASQYDLIIAIEHLNKKETNILNSTLEEAEFVNMVNNPNVRMLVDTYHMLVENEKIEDLTKHAHNIVHVHIADGVDRSYPHKDKDFYIELNLLLKSVNYQGGISVECNTKDMKSDTISSINVLKEIFD